MKAIRIVACASLLASLPSVVTAAQDRTEPKTTTTEVKNTKLKRVGGDLVGMSLVTPKNDLLGKVEDVVIHPKGDVAFVEVTGSGVLKTGTKRFAVPWNALTCNENGQFVLATTPEAFAKMPFYDKKANLTDMEWWIDNDRKYAKLVSAKATPAEASSSLAPAKILYLGSDLRSRSIEDPEGAKIATMHEVVVDPRAGRIAYVVLSVGGGLGAGEKMIAVPWEALKSMPDKSNPKLDRLTLSTTKEKLEQAPEFQATTTGWTTASEPDYVLRVYEYYTVPPYRLESRTEPQ